VVTNDGEWKVTCCCCEGYWQGGGAELRKGRTAIKSSELRGFRP
jgi:hypothetical protein